MRFLPSDATVPALLVAAYLFPAVFGFVTTPASPVQRRKFCTASRGRSAVKLSASAAQTTNDYLQSLSAFADPASPVGTSATDVYLNSLSNIADLSSASSAVDLAVSNPEEYLTVVSTFADNAGSFNLASEMSTAVNSSPPGVFDATGIPEAAAENVPSSISSTDLSSQLSELSKLYTNGALLDEKYVEKATKVSGPASLQGADIGNIAAGLSERLSSATDGSKQAMTALFGKAGASLQAATQAGSDKLSSALGQAGASLQNAPKAIYGRINQGFETIDAEKSSKLVEGSAKTVTGTVKSVGDASIADLANSVLAGLKAVGGVLMKILETFLETFAGTNVAEIVASAQASVQGVVNGAVATVNNIGNITLREAAQALVALLTMVVKILFAILSAVVKVASGKGIDDWALVASGAVQSEADKLMASVSHTAFDVTHTSFAEYGDMIGHFSQDVTKLMIETAGVMGDAVAVGSPIIS